MLMKMQDQYVLHPLFVPVHCEASLLIHSCIFSVGNDRANQRFCCSHSSYSWWSQSWYALFVVWDCKGKSRFCCLFMLKSGNFNFWISFDVSYVYQQQNNLIKLFDFIKNLRSIPERLSSKYDMLHSKFNLSFSDLK